MYCKSVCLCILTFKLLFHKLVLPEKYLVFYRNKKLCLFKGILYAAVCLCLIAQAATILINVNRRLKAGAQYLLSPSLLLCSCAASWAAWVWKK